MSEAVTLDRFNDPEVFARFFASLIESYAIVVGDMPIDRIIMSPAAYERMCEVCPDAHVLRKIDLMSEPKDDRAGWLGLKEHPRSPKGYR